MSVYSTGQKEMHCWLKQSEQDSNIMLTALHRRFITFTRTIHYTSAVHLRTASLDLVSAYLSAKQLVCFSLSPVFLLSVCLSVCLPTCLPVCLSACLSVCLSVSPPSPPSLRPFSPSLSPSLSLSLSLSLSPFLSLYLSLSPSLSLSLSVSVSVSVCLSVSPPLSLSLSISVCCTSDISVLTVQHYRPNATVDTHTDDVHTSLRIVFTGYGSHC